MSTVLCFDENSGCWIKNASQVQEEWSREVYGAGEPAGNTAAIASETGAVSDDARTPADCRAAFAADAIGRGALASGALCGGESVRESSTLSPAPVGPGAPAAPARAPQPFMQLRLQVPTQVPMRVPTQAPAQLRTQSPTQRDEVAIIELGEVTDISMQPSGDEDTHLLRPPATRPSHAAIMENMSDCVVRHRWPAACCFISGAGFLADATFQVSALSRVLPEANSAIGIGLLLTPALLFTLRYCAIRLGCCSRYMPR